MRPFLFQEHTGMNNFEFYSPTEVVFGKNTEERTGEMVVRYGGRHVLLGYASERIVHTG